MKKTVKSIFMVLMMTILVFSLAGCGKNDSKEQNEKADTLVATKEAKDTTFGNYKETVELTFDNGKANKATIKMDFDEEENAKSAEEMLKYMASLTEKISVERAEKRVVVTMEPQEFLGLDEEDSEESKENAISKESLQKELEEQGYEIQK